MRPITPKTYGFYRCALCQEWFEASLCGHVGKYDVCHGCLAYLHETADTDHEVGEWDIERALDAAGWHETTRREATT